MINRCCEDSNIRKSVTLKGWEPAEGVKRRQWAQVRVGRKSLNQEMWFERGAEGSKQTWEVTSALKPVQFSRSVVSDLLRPHGLQHARPSCPSPTPRVYSNSCPLSWWCHPTISSSVVPFSRLESFPALWSSPMSQFFASGGQSIGVSASASVLPMTIQDWFPLGWTGWISLQSEGLSKVFSNTTVQKHQFLGAQLKPRRTE